MYFAPRCSHILWHSSHITAIRMKGLDSLDFCAGAGSHLFTAPFLLTLSVMWQNNFAGKVVEYSDIKV